MSDVGGPVLFGASEGIGRIRLNKPQSLNAMDIEVAEGFLEAVRSLTADEALRVIVIEAEGRSFMAGGDLAYFNQAEDRAQAARTIIQIAHEALERLSQAPQITLASLKGAVAGGGMSLALSFDLAIAADNTVFNSAYARISTSSDCGGTWALPRLVGVRKALEIALLCDNIEADQALQLGLVNKVVPLSELEAETDAMAQRLAAGAPIAQQHIKKLIRTSFDHSLPEQLDAELESFAACAASSDFGGAVASFFEKKKYRFQGR